jgi:serine/threonine protein kinase
MEQSIESLCNLLVRSRLLAPSNVRSIHQRWKTEGGKAVEDVNRFAKWMIANKFVTEFQCGMLLRGKTDHFFFKDYKLLDRLGQGRMAGIYEAAHNQSGQRVAIKVLPPSKAKDKETFARFQREARLSCKLKHPNIVRTFTMGKSEGLYFIVMEYLEGDTLDEVLKKRGKLTPPEAVRILSQALQGLQHIHEKGMIHRDLKPANLMLVPPGKSTKVEPGTATVKILEIGLGRALFDEGDVGVPAGQDLTGTGQLLGTPDYLAPEQARNAHAADIRADIYSLGCTLFHCLAGRPPFPDVNPVIQMVRHASEPPKPLKEFNPAVPDGLQQVVSVMLAKDPAQRYPTPEQAARALQGSLTGMPESGPIPVEPQMQAYLQWLAANPGEEADVELVAVGATPLMPGSGMMPAAALPMAAPPGKTSLMLGVGLGIGIGAIVLFGFIAWLVIKKLTS